MIMTRSRQTERRRPREAEEAQDERPADEDEQDAEDEADAYDDEEDARYEDDYDDDRESDEDHDGGPAHDDESSDEDGSSPSKGGTRRPSKRRMSAASAAQAALRNLAELTTKEPMGITSLESSDGGWVVGIEVVEDKRVPSSTDILAIYEAEIDDEDGSLTSYRRTRRYSRGQGDRGGGS
jgi:Gas vesicle synthesis protein GvpO